MVIGGDLWRQICAGPNKHCTSNTVDEGTPEIIQKSNGYFYGSFVACQFVQQLGWPRCVGTDRCSAVTFHGYDYGAKRSARGVAKTADWHTWIVSGDDLPGDAIFSGIDCDPWQVDWNGVCIGGMHRRFTGESSSSDSMRRWRGHDDAVGRLLVSYH